MDAKCRKILGWLLFTIVIICGVFCARHFCGSMIGYWIGFITCGLSQVALVFTKDYND